MIDCVLDIQLWSNSHRLKLNAAKSEVIWLGTRQQLAKLSQANLTLSMGSSVLQPSTVVRNLGVYIDDHLSMKANARQCAKTCFFHLRRIRQLRRHLDYDTLYTLIRALILSRLDYCNSLFANSSQSTLHRLQRVQDDCELASGLLMWTRWQLTSCRGTSPEGTLRLPSQPRLF